MVIDTPWSGLEFLHNKHQDQWCQNTLVVLCCSYDGLLLFRFFPNNFFKYCKVPLHQLLSFPCKKQLCTHPYPPNHHLAQQLPPVENFFQVHNHSCNSVHRPPYMHRYKSMDIQPVLMLSARLDCSVSLPKHTHHLLFVFSVLLFCERKTCETQHQKG